jgi:hypothetical protein
LSEVHTPKDQQEIDMKKENQTRPARRFNEPLVPLDEKALQWLQTRAVDLHPDPNNSPLIELVRYLAAHEPLQHASSAAKAGKHPLSGRAASSAPPAAPGQNAVA